MNSLLDYWRRHEGKNRRGGWMRKDTREKEEKGLDAKGKKEEKGLGDSY